ncbi:alpha-mannosidase [Citrus sinensis]|uniref:Alpha-mannosidase n=1 Tax=Citrus sinensis TaxID=2711 RepID=A0ACB8LAB3_CITSI|nr:alpha-mannosidase [Citrus sinensis]
MMYNTSAGIVPGKINVHLVPHSHDDVGWLKTVDQYYVGSNNSIQVACVQNVLDSLIPALVADKNRKFIYVEQAITHGFFALLSFDFLLEINGGMCMHDEAAPHYIDMIDQTTLGHRYIKEQFNVTPRIGWQIDPFGHSAVQAYLLSAEVGFDFLFFARIDYQDRAKRINEKTLEVVWRASKSLGSSAQIMTGISPKNYEPPSDNFYFEVGDTSPIVQDDMNLFDYNVPERVNDFVSAAIAQANITRTNHIMWTMGTDFKYQYAHTWFRQMDKFIHYVNQDGRVNALYSTPSMYIDAKYAANESWPLKTDDFFPYADRENAYWTGYFTSRPALKGYVRTMSAYYLAARQLEFFKGRNEVGLSTDSLADALALVQHHDAVSGTEKQHVADDYAKRLSIGYTEAEKCPLLNISYCPPSEVDLSSGKSLVVVVYNPLGWKREDIIRIPVINENVTVKDSKGKVIESQLLPLLKDSMSLRNSYSTAYLGKSTNVTPSYWLAFSASVPPLGFNTYIISSAKQAASHSGMRTVYKSQISQNDTIEVGPGNLKLLYSGKRAKLMRYINSKTSVNKLLEQSYIYYRGDDGSKDLQPSGAYIFRPNGTYPIEPEGQLSFTILRGPLLDEVHQRINPWIYQVTRVYKGKDHAEIEFTVGPIPIDDGIGKEVVTQITSNMISNKTFYTDSSGRDFIERIRDYRKDWNLEVNQPIAGNYYPVNLGIYMKDNSSELSILVDRSVGGSSIADGQLELMLHRRLVADDNRGVSEALNETVCVFDKCEGLTIIGKYYLRIDPVGEAAKWRRSFGQEIYSPFLLAFTEQDGDHWANSHLATYSAMDTTYVLPDNVALITLQELDSGKVLLRLAHLYEIEEDTDLSVMSSVELKKVFPKKKISKVTEMNLSANQERAVMEKKRLVWRVEGSSKEQPTAVRGSPVDPAKLVVELAPMEIRTFVIEFYSERGSFSDALYRRSNLRRKATFSLP